MHGPFIFGTFIRKILLHNLSDNKTTVYKLLMGEDRSPPTKATHAVTIYFDKMYLSKGGSARFRFGILYFRLATQFVCGILNLNFSRLSHRCFVYFPVHLCNLCNQFRTKACFDRSCVSKRCWNKI